MALNAGYFRTWYGNFLVTDNQGTTASDYDPFCVTVPTDERLPGGGSNQVCGLYDIKPGAFGRVDNVVTQHTHYGKQTEVYNGVDVGLEARLARGARFQAGVGVGRTTTDTCDFNSLPQLLPNFIGGTAVSTTVVTPRTSDFCHINRPWSAATGASLVFIYPLPWDFQVSALYFDKPGIPRVASRAYTNAEIRPSLGRDLGQCRGARTLQRQRRHQYGSRHQLLRRSAAADGRPLLREPSASGRYACEGTGISTTCSTRATC